MTKEMKVNLSIIVSFLTILGTTIVGGVAFGSLEEGLRKQEITVADMQERALRLEKQTYEINTKVTEVATDLRWIRIVIEEYAKSTNVQAQLNKPTKRG